MCYGVLYVDFSVVIKNGKTTFISTSRLFYTDLKEEHHLVLVKLTFKMVGYFHIFSIKNCYLTFFCLTEIYNTINGKNSVFRFRRTTEPVGLTIVF